MLSAPTVLADVIPGSLCQGDFDFDANVDADDLTIFLDNFEREGSYYPCPPSGPTPAPKTGQTIHCLGKKQ